MYNLILIPSALEFDRFSDRLSLPSSSASPWVTARCGWGVLDAAIQTSQLIDEYSPGRVILTGIAGTFCPSEFPVGTATQFDSVRLHGIGVGQLDEFRSADELGWESDTPSELSLQSVTQPSSRKRRVLLTVCSASANAGEAKGRHERCPDVIAEDMEGFAVAACCLKHRLPVHIVRGFSNLAGDRKHSNWQIDAAIDAASSVVLSLCAETDLEQ